MRDWQKAKDSALGAEPVKLAIESAVGSGSQRAPLIGIDAKTGKFSTILKSGMWHVLTLVYLQCWHFSLVS